MTNKIFFGEHGRRRIKSGGDIAYEAVRTSYGPLAHDTMIDRKFADPVMTHDGVTIIESLNLKEERETIGFNAGIKKLKVASRKLNNDDGDGTSGVVILNHFVSGGANRRLRGGHNAQYLKRGMNMALDEVLQKINALSEPIEPSSSRLKDVAYVSASDEEIGSLVAEVVSKVGKEGVITIETSGGFESTPEYVDGYTFDRGYLSHVFVTDGEEQEAVFTNPVVITSTKRIDTITELLPILKENVEANKSMLFIVDDIDDKVLEFFVKNKLQGLMNVAVVKAPSWADNRARMMDDLSVLLGSQEKADGIKQGVAAKVIVTKTQTTIVSVDETKPAVQARIDEITNQEKAETVQSEKEHLRNRRALLTGMMAVIRVGGTSEADVEKKRFDYDDAICSARAALVDGIVAGGGITLINLADSLDIPKYRKRNHWFWPRKITTADTIQAGRDVVKQALYHPFLQLMENSGLNGKKLLKQVRQAPAGYGVNIFKPEDGIVDMKKAGVPDATKIVKDIITIAVSDASTTSTAGALITDVNDDRVLE